MLVKLVHTVITFLLCDDLARILDDDLIWLERTIRSNSIAAIERFADLDTNSVLASCFGPLAELLESTICAIFRSNVAITAVTFVEHDAIQTIFIAAAIGLANTLR